jgi:hypothetical protein
MGTIMTGSFMLFPALIDISFYTSQFIYGIWWLALPAALFLLLMASVFTWLFAWSRFYKRLNRRKTMLATEYWRPVTFEAVSQEPPQTLMPPLVLRLKTPIIVGYLVLIVAYALLQLSDAIPNVV